MSIISSADQAFLPNLPGYKPRDRHSGAKKQQFKIVNGSVFLKDEYLPAVADCDESSLTSLGGGSPLGKSKKSWFENATVTLTFHGYFVEKPEHLSGDAVQVRKCNIFFYLEDGSIKVVEKPQVNSGVSQGTLVKRALIKKADGSFIGVEDFKIGEDIVIYGRHFRIVDCDEATKRFMRERFLMDPPSDESVAIPQDSYMETRKLLQPGLNDETWGKFHSKKNDHKEFIEAKLGHSVNNSGREGFNRYGNKTLKFKCLWDNTANLYGDAIEFSLQYYLSDDTVEINSIPSATNKDSQRLKLLKRSRLPRSFQSTMYLGSRSPQNEFFHWSDLYIGMELEVYARKLQLIDADSSTREFYEYYSYPLAAPIVQLAPEVIVHQREIPPPTGFGSEEDSLRSVSGSLMPGPPPAKKLGENKVLSFFASLLSGGVDDVDRRFVISFYVQDNTLKVVEPPVRNSGFSGGVFLSRRSVKLENGETLTERNLYVGCKLQILKHRFLLLDSNDSTMRWMEDKALPQSNFYAILDKIRAVVWQDAQNGKLLQKFRNAENPEKPGRATKDTLTAILADYSLLGDLIDRDVTEHELRTVLRANGNKTDTFNYEKLVEQILRPTDEFK